jgi:hypothetical protein
VNASAEGDADLTPDALLVSLRSPGPVGDEKARHCRRARHSEANADEEIRIYPHFVGLQLPGDDPDVIDSPITGASSDRLLL